VTRTNCPRAECRGGGHTRTFFLNFKLERRRKRRRRKVIQGLRRKRRRRRRKGFDGEGDRRQR
jgi:hypothetical protein